MNRSGLELSSSTRAATCSGRWAAYVIASLPPVECPTSTHGPCSPASSVVGSDAVLGWKHKYRGTSGRRALDANGDDSGRQGAPPACHVHRRHPRLLSAAGLRGGAGPFHVVRLAGDALDQRRRRIRQVIHGHRGYTDDPLYAARGTLHIGADLLTNRQAQRLRELFAADEHVGCRRPGGSTSG